MCKIRLILIGFVLTSLFSGCCIKLNDLNPDDSYPVGATITTSNKTIIVEQFQWGNGTWTSNGRADIDNRNYAQGSGYDLNANNVNLNFQLNYPLSKLSMKFGDLGGNSNIRINNDFKNTRRIVNLDGTTLGGVAIVVDAVQQGNNWYGEIHLNGTINDFAIGGQELWLDDICK